MFVQGYTDQVEALDAATGDLLWHWQRTLPQGARPAVKKGIAIFGETIYPRPRMCTVALNARTGLQKWDTAIGPQTGN
jgi:alcohol dehydrogenase (cytochrome c)